MKASALVVLALLGLTDTKSQRQVICYIGSWTRDITNKVDPTLCSTFVLSFADINGSGEITPPSTINRFLKLKTPTSKLTLSLGGGLAGVSGWKSIAWSEENRTLFAENCLSVCQHYNLDGIDIDWEFPSTRDRANFVALHEAVYKVLHPAGLTLTTAVSAGDWMTNTLALYDIPALSKVVDGFNLMTYNMHMDEGWDMRSGVGFNAPKLARRGNSLDEGIRTFLSKSAPAKKIFVGVPFYCRTYLLRDPTRTTPGSPFVAGYQKTNARRSILPYHLVSCPSFICST